jgi:tetratricopeptide (TPR) repeat protein
MPVPAVNEELQSAIERQKQGEVAAALAVYERLCRDDPENAQALRYLGLARFQLGQHQEGIVYVQRSISLTPHNAPAWSDLGRMYALLNRRQEAMRCFRQSVRVDPCYADGWHNLGTVFKQLGEHEAAFAALKNALLLDPTRADTYLNLGNLLIGADQFEDAVECFERAAQHDPTLAAARSRLAHEFSQRGRVKRAEALFRQSLGLDPDHLQGWFGLGRTLEDLGQAEGALSCYLNVLARRPGHPRALEQYLGLVRGEAQGEIMAVAHAALANAAVQDEAKALIGYGLAKYHDRRGEYAEAAAAGQVANSARRRVSGPLDRAKLAARIDGLIATYDADFFAHRTHFGCNTDQPVLIVGLPRSGTTLTEQILAAHPLLHGAGELPDLARIAIRSTEDREKPWQAALMLDVIKSRALADEYLRALRDSAPRERLRISDKSPLNFFHLAFAALLFPGARVVHCRRDARDTALSIWMENFNADQRYATDFDDLAFFAAQYERLMRHWRSVLPLPILEVHYEETVEDVEAQARRLMTFLAVPWDARCLSFYKSERTVQTPSRWQVRQPIYTHSVGRWRAYANHLPGLLTAFADAFVLSPVVTEG